jgi:hypothetical protein
MKEEVSSKQRCGSPRTSPTDDGTVDIVVTEGKSFGFGVTAGTLERAGRFKNGDGVGPGRRVASAKGGFGGPVGGGLGIAVIVGRGDDVNAGEEGHLVGWLTGKALYGTLVGDEIP